MKTRNAVLILGCGLLLTGGCATRKVACHRGWIGGEYAQAKAPCWFHSQTDVGPTIFAFPAELKTQQTAAVLVSAVFSNTPAATAGLQPGDLILKIDDHPTPSVKTLRKAIDRAEPGAEATFSVYRAGRLEEHRVKIGREDFENWMSFSVTLGLGSRPELDLVPNPEFAVGVLGYRRLQDRTEIHSPKIEFIRGTQAPPGQPPPVGWDSDEGWHTWLTIFNLKRYHRILSQDVVGAPAPATAALQSERP